MCIRPGCGTQGELSWNLFLRCDDPKLAAAWHTQPGLDLLAKLRRARDTWGGGRAVLSDWAIWLIQSIPPLAQRVGLHR